MVPSRYITIHATWEKFYLLSPHPPERGAEIFKSIQLKWKLQLSQNQSPNDDCMHLTDFNTHTALIQRISDIKAMPIYFNALFIFEVWGSYGSCFSVYDLSSLLCHLCRMCWVSQTPSGRRESGAASLACCEEPQISKKKQMYLSTFMLLYCILVTQGTKWNHSQRQWLV